MPSEDHLRWAEALQIEKMHGADAGRWVAERITALAAAGDAAGVERFLAIAQRVDQLAGASRR